MSAERLDAEIRQYAEKARALVALHALADDRRQAMRSVEVITSELRAGVRHARDKGATVKEIAEAVGCSRQNIYDLMRKG